jgi:hypothetical protein
MRRYVPRPTLAVSRYTKRGVVVHYSLSYVQLPDAFLVAQDQCGQSLNNTTGRRLGTGTRLGARSEGGAWRSRISSSHSPAEVILSSSGVFCESTD